MPADRCLKWVNHVGPLVQANVGLSSDSGFIYCAAANGRDGSRLCENDTQPGSGGDIGQAAFRART